MSLNLEKEAGVVHGLLAKAERLEADAERKSAEADDCRWQAAKRTAEAFEQSGMAQATFAKAFGIGKPELSKMLLAWRTFGVLYGTEELPKFWEAGFLAADPELAQLEERASEQGRKPSTVRQAELKTSHTLQQASSAKAIMADPTVREAAQRAIIAAEAEEAKARLMANAKPVDVPVEKPSGFNLFAADATLSRARQFINSVSRDVREHSPLDERDAELLADTARQVEIALEILKAVVKAGDLDDAFARMLDGEL